MLEKIYVIGDIHGNINCMMNILTKINYNPKNDLLVLLGDYIDRGENSYEVVQKVKELINNGAIALRGNHEQFALDGCKGNRNQYEIWMYNGGLSTIESYAINNAKVEDDIDFFRSLSMFYETNDHIFVHAGLLPGVALENQTPDNMLWIRHQFIYSDYDWGKTVIFGHTPMKNIYYGHKKIGIDTGCFHTGNLSCIELISGEIYQTI